MWRVFQDKRVVFHLLPVLMESVLEGMTVRLPFERCVSINQVKGVGRVFPAEGTAGTKALRQERN